jgi:hypothetical protein
MTGYVYELCPGCGQTIAAGDTGEMNRTNHVCTACPNHGGPEAVKNVALGEPNLVWLHGDATCTELIRQEYTGNNCVLSGGAVKNAKVPEDVFYIRMEKDGEEPLTVFMRPDEIAAMAWICSGLMYSYAMQGGKNND